MDSPESFIDFGNYGLSATELRSVAAMSSFWTRALGEAAAGGGEAAGEDAEFVAILVELPAALADLRWQRRWLRAWDRLTDQGLALGEIFRFVFGVARAAEAALLDGAGSPRQIHLDLCLAFRRGLVAACCGAIEAKEEIRNLRAGISGELTALHTLDTMARAHRRVAILSISLVNRDLRAHFSARDLQDLPTLIVDRLQTLLRPDDLVFAGREGEWLLLLPDVESRVQPSLAAAQIERAFVDPVVLGSGRPMMLALAIGAALLPDHGRQAEEAIQSARLARWSIQSSESRFAWFSAEQGDDWHRYTGLVRELRGVLERETLMLFLQPQIDLASGKCVGAELLLRWRRENGEWVPPPEIVAMVEQNGWRPMFTDWLIRAAMRIAAKLRDEGIDITLSINLTAPDLEDSELPELLVQRLETWNLPASCFVLELTESAMMVDRAHGVTMLERLAAAGFRLSLDDFGTGYSSLSYLVSLPIYELKVDQSFVAAMFDSTENMRVVSTIVALANDLGMVPLAEGIDEARHLDQLRKLGCQVGQGYLFSPPLPPAEFVAWFRARVVQSGAFPA